MNEIIRNNLIVATMQVNVQFLQQLQLELSRTYTTTKYKGKEIAKPITPPSETTSEEDNDLEQAQRDTDMQKNLALISNIGFSVLTARNLDILLRNAESQKGLKTLYHKEKMFLCKQAEQGVPLQAEQYDWLADTDGEIDD
nr:hypothetical protein [Tanacetum cinerariifolium]